MDESLLRTTFNCATTTWQIGIGDPGIMGWVIVGLYLVSGVFAFWVAVAARFPEESIIREQMFWVVLGVVLVALAVNKQIDLQSLLTAAARCLSQLQGWYGERRGVQVGFIAAVIVTMYILFVTLWIVLHGTMRRNGLALFGLVFVLAFVAIRAAGFHGMDRLINARLADFRVNWLLEMAGPAIILVSGMLRLLFGRSEDL